ncbi:shikimate kinase [Microbacterium endophyticum]|uniref:Shikimate kinase n=1 Tax=Microbacterium endophyticum TaxID=1526412 RepID=A0A7W4V556_9MICO|nr:shikimate kinase [Microbacterium endophyticum]MBB2977022.1 shikimate kinase [Microbacterium endophyticum]NIK36692.1 shikimate kinase [Microbacterium endophyticum]
MIAPESRSLVLVGPMGAGKTSVGRRVARALGERFVDTDKSVIREHGAIAEIFSQQGERHFRELERAAVIDALSHGGVIALGGGAVLDPSTRSDLGAHRVVFLTVNAKIVASRIASDDRPLLSGEDPLARWQKIYRERLPLYEEVADATFDTSAGPLAHAVAAIVDWAKHDDNRLENS